MHQHRKLNRLPHLLALLALLACAPLAAQNEDEYLPPGEAFRISGESPAPDSIQVHWEIADGYYLYRSKLKFSAEGGDVELDTPILPEGKIKHDEFFGDVEIYRERLSVTIPILKRPASEALLRLKAISQGCADAGLCYPPHGQEITIPLASPAATGNAPREPNLAALGDLGKSLGLDDGEREIPTPEEAFRFSAEVSDAEHLRLLWQIAEGTYLYQEQVRIGLGGSGRVALGDYTQPAPEIKKNAIRPDGSTGDLAVYHDQIDLTLPLRRATPEATAITLEVRYQGCAEAGVCYPPVTRRIDLALPALQPGAPSQPPAQPQPRSSDSASPAGDEALSEQDRIASTISGGNLWVIIPTFFGLGLLLSLTPCVFPMIPILSGIIAGHGTQISAGKGFTLSMVYVQAMALTYTAVGIATGLSGANLQAAFQDPRILSAFALVFVLLALSMFGFYDLQLPSRWQSKLTEVSNRQQGGSLIGVAVMGLLSALIVGPCVAPPLFGALIYIGQTGDALLGGIALYALSMGMGAPLLLIGTSAGRLLPRAGAWMDTIKTVFGVALLAVAIIMLERILPPALAMTLWGVLLISSAIYLGALQPLPVEASGWDRLWKGVGVVLLVYGSLMLVGAAAGGRDTVQPLRGILLGAGATGAPAETGHLTFRRIKSVQDLEDELATASAARKPLMLDFYADWCVSCKEMERYTFSDPGVIAALADFVLLQADVTANDETDQALMQGHFGLPGPPAIIFYGTDGAERRNLRVVGFMDADAFQRQIGRVRP